MRSSALQRSAQQLAAGRPSRTTAILTRAVSTAGPARPTGASKRPQNVSGDYWVDNSCIDCDTCRWMAPDVFQRVEGQSAVVAQPHTHKERVRAMQALLSCPTFSIHADKRTKEELQDAQQGLPAPIPEVPNVYHCGYHSEKSFAACSYLITRPGGNVMVDTPRFNPVLARQIQAMGGIRYIFLTHKDDVGDHEKWAQAFKATRILHKGELRPGTANVEIKLEGEGPWEWRDIAQQAGAAQDTGDDLELVFTPGHTSHHVCMVYKPGKTLFSGDHLCSPEVDGKTDELYVFKDFNWHDFDKQLDSVAKLLKYDWLHVLPGHGRQVHLKDAQHREEAVATLLRKHGRTTS